MLWEKKAGEVTGTAVQGTLQSGREGSLVALAFLALWGMAPLFFLSGPLLGLPSRGPAWSQHPQYHSLGNEDA